MVAPARSHSPESSRESRPTMSMLDRVLKAVHAGWTDYNQSAEASAEAQARFARRIGKNDIIHLDGEDWKIVAVSKGDDEAPVLIENGKLHRSIASLDLERVEIAARLIGSVDGDPVPEGPEVVPTGTTRVPPTPVVAELEDDEAPKVPLKLRYGAVDVSEAVEDRARDTAEESLHAEKIDAGFFAKIFKHNICYEIYRQIAISRSRAKILNEKNLYASDNFDRDAHRRATGAVVDRFVTEYDGFLHGEGKTAEKKKVFGDSAAEKAVKKDLEALVREYATNPEMDAGELNARKDEIFAAANKLAGDAKGRGVMYADNLEKLAEQVRQHAAHAGGIANLDIDLEIVIGKAKLGARTERDRNLLDKALDGLQRYGSTTRVGSGVLNVFHNEISVALGTAWVVGGIYGRVKAGAAALASSGSSLVVTGAYSAYKEKSRLGRERSLHERQMALGGETRNDDLLARKSELLNQMGNLKWWNVMERHAIENEIKELDSGRAVQPRRAEMEQFELARESAKGLAESARGFLSGRELRGDVDDRDAMSALADIEARIRISDREKVDLLKYTNVAEAEVERMDLDLARAQLKAALRSRYAEAMGNFTEVFNERLAMSEGALYGKESAVQKQHSAFASWSNRVALKRGATTMVIGAVVGTVVHDLWSHFVSGADTTIASAGRALMAYFDNAPVAAVGPANVETIGGGMFTTPAGTDLVPQADGSYVLESVADHRTIASGLHINEFGHLDAASEATLRGASANIVESDQWVNSSSTVTSTESTWDWLRHHAMQKVYRDHWMDNDTPMHFSDALQKWLGADWNELKLEWGGVNETGLDANGQIVMSAGYMTSDGSFHDALSEDAPKEIVERKLRLLLTMNSGSQNSVIEVLCDQHGQFHIDPDSDIGKTFFRIEHGKVVPLYHHAEIGISKGFDAHGVNHFNILATAQGEGVHSGITSTDISESVNQHVTQIDFATGPNVPPVAVPWFLPGNVRTPMEPRKRRTPRMPPPGGDDLPPGGSEFEPVISGVESGTESGDESPISGAEVGRSKSREKNAKSIRTFVSEKFGDEPVEVQEMMVELLQVLFQKTPASEQKAFMKMVGEVERMRHFGHVEYDVARTMHGAAVNERVSLLATDTERDEIVDIVSLYLSEHPDMTRQEDIDRAVEIAQILTLDV